MHEGHTEETRAARSQSSLAVALMTVILFSTSFGAAAGYVAGGWCAGSPGVGWLQARIGLNPACAARNPGDVSALSPFVSSEEEVARIAAVKVASPAVVSIVVSKDVPKMERYFYNPFGDSGALGDSSFRVPALRQNGTEHREIGAGSGFIVSADGYIITNRHVVSDEAAEYTVVLQDARQLPAKVLARDPSNDIAILKIEGADFSFISLGDSDKIEVGQSAIAIGYALGRYGNTVSTGIISGIGRSIEAGDGGESEELFDVLQTDAAINPGNSGGPLLNLHGEVVGMNVAIVQGSQNIGFALPINDVRSVYESVRTTGRVVRPFLGIRYQLITPELQKANQLPVEYGALIVRGEERTDLAIVPGSPADKAGITENDIILEINGKKIDETHPLSVLLRRYKPGDTLQLKLLKKGEEKTVSLTLEEKK